MITCLPNLSLIKFFTWNGAVFCIRIIRPLTQDENKDVNTVLCHLLFFSSSSNSWVSCRNTTFESMSFILSMTILSFLSFCRPLKFHEIKFRVMLWSMINSVRLPRNMNINTLRTFIQQTKPKQIPSTYVCAKAIVILHQHVKTKEDGERQKRAPPPSS